MPTHCYRRHRGFLNLRCVDVGSLFPQHLLFRVPKSSPRDDPKSLNFQRWDLREGWLRAMMRARRWVIYPKMRSIWVCKSVAHRRFWLEKSAGRVLKMPLEISLSSYLWAGISSRGMIRIIALRHLLACFAIVELVLEMLSCESCTLRFSRRVKKSTITGNSKHHLIRFSWRQSWVRGHL